MYLCVFAFVFYQKVISLSVIREKEKQKYGVLELGELKEKEIINRIKDLLKDKNVSFSEELGNSLCLIATIGNEQTDDLYIELDTERQILIFTAEVKLRITQDKWTDFAVLISVINDIVSIGSYDFDCESGDLFYRSTISCVEDSIDADTIFRALISTADLTDKYYNLLCEYSESPDFEGVVSKAVRYRESSKYLSPKDEDIQVYNRLLATIKGQGWRHRKNEDELKIYFDYQGEDVPMSFDILVKPETKLIALQSVQPFIIRREKRKELAVAVCAVSNVLVDGCFSYNWGEDKITFRVTYPYNKSNQYDKVLEYMISCSINTVEGFNDKFLELNKGQIKMKQFMKSINRLGD